MPELRTLLTDEAVRRQPAELPPFRDVRSRARRRTGTRVVAAGLAVAAVAVGAVVIAGGTEPTSDQYADPVATPGRFESAALSFDYPPEWRVAVGSPDSTGAQILVELGTAPLTGLCDSDGRSDVQVNCVAPAGQLGASGVSVRWVAHDPGAGEPGLEAVSGDETVIDGRQAWTAGGQPTGVCARVGGEREVRAWIRLTGRAWLSMTACLAAPTDETEQQVRDMLASVDVPGGPAAEPATTSFRSAGLSFRYPSGWVDSVWDWGLHGTVLVELGPGPLNDPCTILPDEPAITISCGRATPTLAAGEVYVRWQTNGSASAKAADIFPYAAGTPTVVNGYEAKIDRPAPSADCTAAGGTRQIVVLVRASAEATSLTMSACLASPIEDTEQQVLDMLDSVVIPD